MTGRRRVVVTGCGMVTPLGASLASTVEALERSHTFEPPSVFDASGFAETCAGEVKDFDARSHFRVTKALKLTDRAARFAVAAATMALADAGWPADDESELERLGVVVGSSSSDLRARDLASALQGDAELRSVRDIPFFAERILSGLNPLWLLISLPNMSSAHVAIQLRAKGPNSTIMTDWVAGSQAIGEAFEWIREGEADAVLAGGADSGLTPFTYSDYQTAGLFSFQSNEGAGPRRFVPAEGAAMLLLEEREHALQRGAAIRSELCGYASASAPLEDAKAVGGALARTMTAAIGDAGWDAGDVDAVGTASVFCSPYCAIEERALAHLFGDRAAQPPRREFKSRLGHALGASGAIDAALLVELNHGSLLCNSLGFSGQAVTLAFHKAG